MKAWLTPTQVLQAMTLYGLHATRLEVTQSGYRNQVYMVSLADGTNAVLRVHKNEPDTVPRIQRTLWLCENLASLGQPVPCPRDARLMQLSSSETIRYACLLLYLPGETIPWEAYTMKHIKLLGWAMAGLHRNLKRLDTSGFPRVVDEYDVILQRMVKYFGSDSTGQAVADKLSLELQEDALRNLQTFLAFCTRLPGQQLLHMDFVRGNVLFGEHLRPSLYCEGAVTLTGILDFEKASVGHPLFDLARTLAFLLVDCGGKTTQQIRKYFLQSGYAKRGQSPVKPLSVTSANGVKYDVLETAIDMFLLYDFYKFLRDNPYESLHENYHYLRTRDILLQKNVLRQIKTEHITPSSRDL